MNLQFKIDRSTWQKYFALFCKTICSIISKMYYLYIYYICIARVRWCWCDVSVIGGNLRTDIKIVVLAPGILFVIMCFANIHPQPSLPRNLSPLPLLQTLPSRPSLPSRPIPAHYLSSGCVAVFLHGVSKFLVVALEIRFPQSLILFKGQQSIFP